MKTATVKKLFNFQKKSKIKAGEGLDQGKYPFYASSKTLSKYMDNYLYEPTCLVFGTGGKASVHLATTPFATSTDCLVIRPKPDTEIDINYVFQYLKGNIRVLEQGFKGAGLKHISKKYLSKLQIPYPEELNDQKRIAHLLGKMEGLIARRKQHLQQLDELLKSVFLEMFGDPVRNEKGWKKKLLRKLAMVKIGPFGSLLHAEDYITGGIPLVNPSHVVDGEIKIDESLTITEKKFCELSSYHLALNDVVIARRGEIGRCALVKTKSKLLCGTGSMFARITDEYLPLMLQFMIFRTSLKSYLESKAKGVTMKNLNSSILENMEVIYPPIDLQNQFAVIVEKVEGIKTQYQQSLTELENLYGALSQKAFKGELDLSRVLLTTEETENREKKAP